MGRPCSVCLRPDRHLVDEALLAGEIYRNISARSGIPPANLSRHRAHMWRVATPPAPVGPPRNTVLCRRDLELLRLLPDGSVDVWWASPPYNLGDPHRGGERVKRRRWRYADSTGGGDGLRMRPDDYERWQVAVLTEWYRTLGPGGVAFYSHKPQHDGRRMRHPMEWIARTPLTLIDRLVWNRRGTANVDTCRLLPISEEVYVLARAPGVYLHNPQRIKNVFDYAPTHHKRAESGHPCPTPPELVRLCLSLVPRPRDGRRLVVADCYAGTGTTGLVARELGMDFVLGDASPEYVALAERNLALPAIYPLASGAAG